MAITVLKAPVGNYDPVLFSTAFEFANWLLIHEYSAVSNRMKCPRRCAGYIQQPTTHFSAA